MPALTDSIADELTGLEATVLDYLARTLRIGFCPSREELSRGAGLGARGYHISKVLESLEEKGYVRRVPGRSRSLELLRKADGRRFDLDTIPVPVVGLVGASKPRETAVQVDNAFADEPAIELTRSLVSGYDDLFALRVSGDSMIDALVNDGDIVILTATAEIHNGDMVAARVTGTDGRDAGTLKRFYRENDHVRLQPANVNMPALCYHPSQVKIEGKVVLIIRHVE